jgi:type VII secretion protein EccE
MVTPNPGPSPNPGPNPAPVRGRAVIPPPAGAPLATPAHSTATPTVLGPGTRRVKLAQVICWQIAAVLVVVGIGSGPVLLVVAMVVAPALVVPTVLPWRGRWAYQWLALAVAHGSRRHAFTAPVPEGGQPAGDPRRALLAFAAPGTVLGEASIDDDEKAGLLAHPAGLTCVLEIQADDRTLYATPPRALPALLSLLPAGDDDPLPTTLQVLLHTEPGAAEPGTAGESYRALTAGRVPAMRRCLRARGAARTAALRRAPSRVVRVAGTAASVVC